MTSEPSDTTLIEEKLIALEPFMIEEGLIQLLSEIQVLSSWQKELENLDQSHEEVKAAKKSYGDMLTSRKRMIETLIKRAIEKNDSSYINALDKTAKQIREVSQDLYEVIANHPLSRLPRKSG